MISDGTAGGLGGCDRIERMRQPVPQGMRSRSHPPFFSAGLTHNTAYEKNGCALDVRILLTVFIISRVMLRAYPEVQQPDESPAETRSNPAGLEEG